MRSLKNLLSLTLAVVFAAGCNKVEFQKTSSGLPYKIFTDNKGDSILPNYYVKFEVIQSTKDTVLFSSYEKNQPQYLQVQPTPPQGVNYSDIGGNIMEILPKLRKGDSVYIVQVTDSLIAQSPEMAGKTFKKGEELVTTIRVTEVYKTLEEASAAVAKDRMAQAAEMEKEGLERFRSDTATSNQMQIDNRLIDAYLSKNNIQTRKTEWGVYMNVQNEGQGPKPAPGQFVRVKYAGKTLNGVAFDSGEFPMQIGTGNSIKGFEDGIKQLAKGGKATLYIPSRLGYGPPGSGPKIGPNENLIFDIELLEISDTPPQQQQQQSQHYEGDGHNH
ncbi:MAG: FKBP-type peptidyl-prolyl cis-trans isomerase [Flavisolibacter sp.]|jgi:FKBP-type peptidyl-prolyl cis-trans isomerase|nr:FKBP-type peptidyl-prolyl cis-trans isomerase [Flavisolibacter sp.]